MNRIADATDARSAYGENVLTRDFGSVNGGEYGDDGEVSVFLRRYIEVDLDGAQTRLTEGSAQGLVAALQAALAELRANPQA